MTEDEVIATVVETVAGHDVLPLIEALKGKKNVSEFTLAESLKQEINTVRNMLYRLYDSNLVRFTRKKDKKKGWYIYYWTFVPSRVPFLMKDMKKKKLEKLRERLSKEQGGNFYECANKCLRLGFESAMDHEFKCPECGQLMHQQENAKRIESLKHEIEQLINEISAMPDVVEEPFEEMEEVEEEIDEDIVKERTVQIETPKTVSVSIKKTKIVQKKASGKKPSYVKKPAKKRR
jgi:transcription initiation factor TFIIE subunit alpha